MPRDGWIEVGDADEAGGGASMSATAANGSCGSAAWSLSLSARDAQLRHLPREWLYRAPLPRTKLTSPAPLARFDGELRLDGDREITLDGWSGMVGHNWGSEHAERWIWLHGVDFAGSEQAWLDVALGRVRIAGRTTPWVANGALSLDGRRLRVGGLGARGLSVAESARRMYAAAARRGRRGRASERARAAGDGRWLALRRPARRRGTRRRQLLHRRAGVGGRAARRAAASAP